MRGALAVRLAGTILVGLAGCSTHSDGSAGACAQPTGTVELSVAATGQSENLSGTCSDSDPPQTVDFTFSNGSVAVGGETCVACTSGDCVIQVLCGDSVSCPDSIVAAADAGDDYVQLASFTFPTNASTPTPNAVLTLGPSYCGYSGTAALVTP